jgi:hypothetical protein
MSGTRVFANEGQAATWVDVQRAFDVAASSEDRVWSLVFRPQWAGTGVYDKKVHPLTPEPKFQSYVRPRLVYPGTITGGVDILPAGYIVGSPGDPSADANVSVLSATGYLDTITQLPSLYSLPATAFPSSSGSDGRVDLVYAIVESVATEGERKVKHPLTGQVTTQELTLYTSPTVTFGVVTGEQDGSFTVNDPPADTATEWHFPLAFVLLDDGALGPWTQGTAIAQTRITQTWDGGWVSRNRVQLAQAASIMSTTYVPGNNGRASTPLSNRWGGSIGVSMVLQHKTDGTGVYVSLDTSHDWSRRLLRVTLMSIVSDLTGSNLVATTPDSESVPPLSILTAVLPFVGVCFTPGIPLPGYLGGQMGVLAIPLDTGKFLNLYVDDNGYLKGEFAGVPYDYNGTTPVYLVIVEASDQFLL